MLIGGCSLAPVSQDEAVTLKPNEGIAVLIFQTLDPINGITFKSPDNNDISALDIDRVLPGTHMLVFILPEATYCLISYHYMDYIITQNDQKHGDCFDVVAGKIAYSGDLVPGMKGGVPVVLQDYQWAAFKKRLGDEYPKLASYPIVAP
jgi:hypothetical protein